MSFLWDVINWLAFALGQGLFLLKRADLARRSPLNGVKSIGEFFSRNWITLIFRGAIEFCLIFWPYRHNWADLVIAKLGWNFHVHVPQSLVLAFLLGLASDMLMDWAVMQDSIAGVKIPVKLKENIPQLPQVQQLVSQLGEK